MEFNIQAGLVGEKAEKVTKDKVASKYASGTVDVYATPAMIALMEYAAHSCVEPMLPQGWATVGTRLDVRHLAATPVGMEVKATARLLEVEGRKLLFEVEAFDDKEKIGAGIHERYIVNLEKFMSKVNSK